MKETNIQQLCRIAASDMGAIVWRNNVGKLQDRNGQWVAYGVCNPGGSDLIGIYKGRFLALEVKQPGKSATTVQENFLRAVRQNGGIAGVVRSPEDVRNLLTQAII